MAETFGLSQPYGWGRAYQHPIKAKPPAAGAIYSVSLSSSYRWRLVSAIFSLTTDSNAANRYVTVDYLAGDGNPTWANGAAVVVTANTTAQRFVGSYTRGQSEWAANTDVFFPINPAYLDGGGAFRVNVANIQVGDTLTNLYFLFDRFPTDPEYLPGETN